MKYLLGEINGKATELLEKSHVSFLDSSAFNLQNEEGLCLVRHIIAIRSISQLDTEWVKREISFLKSLENIVMQDEEVKLRVVPKVVEEFEERCKLLDERLKLLSTKGVEGRKWSKYSEEKIQDNDDNIEALKDFVEEHKNFYSNFIAKNIYHSQNKNLTDTLFSFITYLDDNLKFRKEKFKEHHGRKDKSVRAKSRADEETVAAAFTSLISGLTPVSIFSQDSDHFFLSLGLYSFLLSETFYVPENIKENLRRTNLNFYNNIHDKTIAFDTKTIMAPYNIKKAANREELIKNSSHFAHKMAIYV